MKSKELKPCHWCGSINTDIDSRLRGLVRHSWKPLVICHDCGASGPFAETRPAAIAAWNTRPVSKVERLAGEVVKAWSVHFGDKSASAVAFQLHIADDPLFLKLQALAKAVAEASNG